GVDIDLGPTGVLETINGSIAFSAGEFGDLRGDIVARGVGSDVLLSANQSLRIRGSIEANHDILLSAGSQVVAGQTSVKIDGTSFLSSTGGGGRIIVTGQNDVVFDGVVGTGSTDLALLRLDAVHGNLTIPKTSGRIESDALIELTGKIVDVQGVVKSTRTTASTSDYEITIDASDTARINGDLQLTGSMKIDADNLLEVYNTTIAISQPGQRLTLSGGDIRFGKAALDTNGFPVQLGAQVTALDLIEISATGAIDIGSGSIVATSGAASRIDASAAEIAVAGSLIAGAHYGADGSGPTFTGPASTLVLHARESVTLGGVGIIGGLNEVVGGTAAATGAVSVVVSGGSAPVSVTIGPDSILKSVHVGDEPAGTSHLVSVDADRDIQVFGTIESMSTGADVTIWSDELVLVDGLVRAADQLTISGGDDATDVSISVQAFVYQTNGLGEVVNDPDGSPIRLAGGTLSTAAGGTITLNAVEQVLLKGVVGEVVISGGASVATTHAVTVLADGTVYVSGSVNAADLIRFRADGVTIDGDAVIRARAVGGQVDLRTTGALLMVAASAGAEPPLVQAAELVHLAGDVVNL
ncbi:MAG TPA: hypothetical protein PLV92_20245, partial [Pirellulaceae bacterium]|nr:hypothetical protein [Pirellulaceae bacterium]